MFRFEAWRNICSARTSVAPCPDLAMQPALQVTGVCCRGGKSETNSDRHRHLGGVSRLKNTRYLSCFVILDFEEPFRNLHLSLRAHDSPNPKSSTTTNLDICRRSSSNDAVCVHHGRDYTQLRVCDAAWPRAPLKVTVAGGRWRVREGIGQSACAWNAVEATFT